jgi:hypothetical protein
LGIKKSSELYNELKDKAAIDAGIIPKDLLSDQEILNALPMFFRTVRSEKPTAEEIEKLIEKIICPTFPGHCSIRAHAQDRPAPAVFYELVLDNYASYFIILLRS